MQAKEAVGPLSEAMNDESAGMRRSAASALGRIGDPQAAAALRKALKDKDHFVRSVAANSLGQIKDHDSIRRLKALLKDEVDSVRVSAAGALGMLGNKDGLETAMEVLENSKDIATRSQAAKALAEVGDASSLSAMEKLYEEAEDDYFKQSLKAAIENLKANAPKGEMPGTKKKTGKKSSK